jgi:hypothetical protein
VTILDVAETGSLGEIRIQEIPGSTPLTAASRIGIRAIATHQGLLRGNGIDWGSGTGCLSIASARVAAVERIIGLEISSTNVVAARHNAALNDVADRATFLLSDSYKPIREVDRTILADLHGRTDFVVANPPSSGDDDGFGFRRLVLDGARRFLVPGGVVLLNISLQYGPQRIERLAREVPGYRHGGVLASTDWVPFDLHRPDLMRCLEDYVCEERRGGSRYVFADPRSPERSMGAEEAWTMHQETGMSPLTKWQTHLFRHVGQ